MFFIKLKIAFSYRVIDTSASRQSLRHVLQVSELQFILKIVYSWREALKNLMGEFMLKNEKLTEQKSSNKMNHEVDWYFTKAKKWQEELEKLRLIVLDCGLTEELKWGVPCYTLQKNNIVLIHVFKEYCAILFFKGALIDDIKGILVQQTKNVQATRQIRFTNVSEIVEMETIIKAYIFQAIEVEKAGLKVNFKKTAELEFPEEFQQYLSEMPELKTAFDALTPGRRKGYILYFSAAKQSKTRVSRVEKSVERILAGKGLDD